LLNDPTGEPSLGLALAHLQPQHTRDLEPGVLVGECPLRQIVPISLDRSVVQLLIWAACLPAKSISSARTACQTSPRTPDTATL
jgi:hypothetical protein